MVRLNRVLVGSLAIGAQAAGGADQYNTISQTAFQALLAAGKNCDQQDAADQMVDLAKTLNNDPEMIRLAQLFAQQSRNAPDSLQVPYCQAAPKNAELDGLFHCQFSSSDFPKFSGDQMGSLPLGVTAVSPPGSCPAKTDGLIPDGVQLITLVKSPGLLSNTRSRQFDSETPTFDGPSGGLDGPAPDPSGGSDGPAPGPSEGFDAEAPTPGGGSDGPATGSSGAPDGNTFGPAPDRNTFVPFPDDAPPSSGGVRWCTSQLQRGF